MPVAPLVTHAVSVTAQETAALEYMIHVDSSNDDFLDHEVTVVNFVDWKSQAWRQIGAKLYMDRGDGALALLKKSELGPEITLRSSLDGYGVREVAFTLLGKEKVPTKNALIRGMRAVRLIGQRGTPAGIYDRIVFDGFIRDSEFQGYPPVARITAQDSSIEFASVRMFFNLEQGSQRSRESVLLEVCEDHGVPVGTWDMPVDADGNRGGLVYKAISEGGDRTVLEWVTEFLVPIGARPRWSGGRLDVFRPLPIYAEGSSIRTLKAGDFRSVTITPPPTNATNQAVLSAQIFDYTGPSGQFTNTEDTLIPGTYTPLVASVRQNKTNGALTNITPATGTVDYVGRRIVTTTREGGTVVSQTITEYGWYAPLIARKRQGATAYNNQADAYQYADGSWRATETEQFQVVRVSHKVRGFDPETGILSTEGEFLQRFYPLQIPRAAFDTADGSEDALDVMMTDDGVAWAGNGVETLVAEQNIINHYAREDGRYSTIETFTYATQANAYNPTNAATGAYSAPIIYVFGPTNAKRYGTLIGTNQQLATVRRHWIPVDETQHQQQGQTQPTGFFPASFQHPDNIASASGGTFAGPIPYVEQSTGHQTAQSAKHIETNGVQVALARDAELPDFFGNDYCESDGELRTAALETLRESTTLLVSIEMAVDWFCEAGMYIKLFHPDIHHDEMHLLVWSSDMTYNGADGSNTQRIVCRWINQPELV